MNITPDKYNYKDSGSNWEIEVYYNNQIIATILCPNTGTTTINYGVSSNPITIDFSKLEDVKSYFLWYFPQNRLFFNENGKIKQKNLLGESEDPFSLGVFEVIYPSQQPLSNLMVKAEGKIIDDSSNQPIKGAKIVTNESLPTTSNSKGEVNVKLLNYIPQTSSITEPTSSNLPTVTISSPGYETIEKVPYKGDGTAKEDLGIIQMTPIQTATEADKVEASQLNSDQINRLSDSKKTPEYFAQKKLTDLVINLKQTALPLAITLIAQFGITKAYQLIDQGKTKPSDLKNKILCPTPEELKKLISRKNKLVKQINNSLKIIDNATKALGITEGVIILLDITLFTADNTPSSLNPFTPGLNKILSKTIDKLKYLNAGVLTILILVKQVLTQLLQYLSLLDTLIQQCSPDTELTQETISRELISLTQDQSQDTPVVTNVNGFKMSVETEITTNSLKRRRAIAQNKQGVVMLKGEWSFSSIDQILIDELVFYIQQNDLKAE
jgi:hypothetical protein